VTSTAGALLFDDVLGDLGSRFGFAEVNALVLSNQTKDSPGLEARHRAWPASLLPGGRWRSWFGGADAHTPDAPTARFVSVRSDPVGTTTAP